MSISQAVELAKKMRIAFADFNAKAESGEVVLPPDALDLDESPIVSWPHSIGIAGKYYKINYNEDTNVISLRS